MVKSYARHERDSTLSEIRSVGVLIHSACLLSHSVQVSYRSGKIFSIQFCSVSLKRWFRSSLVSFRCFICLVLFKFVLFWSNLMPGMSETQLFLKFALLAYQSIQHAFCLILFRFHTVRARSSPFSSVQWHSKVCSVQVLFHSVASFVFFRLNSYCSGQILCQAWARLDFFWNLLCWHLISFSIPFVSFRLSFVPFRGDLLHSVPFSDTQKFFPFNSRFIPIIMLWYYF